MSDELRQLDESIKGLSNLRDKNLDDPQYCNYLSDAIDALCRRQEDLILAYEVQRENRENATAFLSKSNNEDDWVDDEF